MKRILILALAIFLFACSGKNDGFTIKVNLEGATGKVLLVKNDGGNPSPVDTAEIENGVAVLKGSVEFPQDMYLSILGQNQRIVIFVENTKMNVMGNVDSLNTVKVTGSATHDDYQKIKDQITNVQEEYMTVYQDARTAYSTGDSIRGQELLQKVQDMYEGIDDLQVEFVKNNPASYFAPVVILGLQEKIEVDELDALVTGLDPKMLELPSMLGLIERIEILKKVAVGKIVPDFLQNDPDGNPVKFSDVYSKNEVTLLDFWASWCQPCRAENPNVVEVYNDYKDKGFTVFGVSLDRDKSSWLEAIAADKLNWTQVSDLSYWDNPVAQLYAVEAIPSSLLVDKNGKIIAKNKRGDELRTTVSEILD